MDQYSLIVPFVDFLARYSMYGEEAKQQFKKYIYGPTTGLNKEELDIVRIFLDMLDEVYT